MSDLEKYFKFSKNDAVYYLKPRKGSERALSKVVGFGTDLCCIFSMKPSEALNLLKWLEQERETLEQLAKEQDPELITLDRFIAMLDERGLSSRRYTEPRYSSSFGNYTAHMIDVGKDGKMLATYDTGAIIGTVFTEKHMAEELDGLLNK